MEIPAQIPENQQGGKRLFSTSEFQKAVASRLSVLRPEAATTPPNPEPAKEARKIEPDTSRKEGKEDKIRAALQKLSDALSVRFNITPTEPVQKDPEDSRFLSDAEAAALSRDILSQENVLRRAEGGAFLVDLTELSYFVGTVPEMVDIENETKTREMPSRDGEVLCASGRIKLKEKAAIEVVTTLPKSEIVLDNNNHARILDLCAGNCLVNNGSVAEIRTIGSINAVDTGLAMVRGDGQAIVESVDGGQLSVRGRGAFAAVEKFRHGIVRVTERGIANIDSWQGGSLLLDKGIVVLDRVSEKLGPDDKIVIGDSAIICIKNSDALEALRHIETRPLTDSTSLSTPTILVESMGASMVAEQYLRESGIKSFAILVKRGEDKQSLRVSYPDEEVPGVDKSQPWFVTRYCIPGDSETIVSLTSAQKNLGYDSRRPRYYNGMLQHLDESRESKAILNMESFYVESKFLPKPIDETFGTWMMFGTYNKNLDRSRQDREAQFHDLNNRILSELPQKTKDYLRYHLDKVFGRVKNPNQGESMMENVVTRSIHSSTLHDIWPTTANKMYDFYRRYFPGGVSDTVEAPVDSGDFIYIPPDASQKQESQTVM